MFSILMSIFFILQWNAQGMNGHGPELIQFLSNDVKTIHVICIQETWYNDDNVIQIPEYTCLSKNRTLKNRGGCAIYIHNSIYFDNICNTFASETQAVDIILGDFTFTIVNYYNPCKEITDVEIESLVNNVKDKTKILIVDDVNSHNAILGSDKTGKMAV